MMKIINQRFTSFQSVMLQTMNDLVIQMVPQLSNQQHPHIPPSLQPQEIFHTQTPTYPYQATFLHFYPPQSISQFALNNASAAISYHHTLPLFIPPQPTQGVRPPITPNQMLPPPELFQVQVVRFITFCCKITTNFDYIAIFVDTILLYMYVFYFDICNSFVIFLILTQLQQYKVRYIRNILRKQRTLFSLVLQCVHLRMQIINKYTTKYD